MTIKKGVCVGALLLALSAGAASAETMYKWVDKDGNVVFSQTPPPDGGTDASMHEVKADGPRPLKPEKRSGGLYCGDMTLPQSYERRPDRQIASLQSSIEEWQRGLERAEQARINADAHPRRRYSEEDGYDYRSEVAAQTSSSIAQLKCAIQWGKQEMDALAGGGGEGQ